MPTTVLEYLLVEVLWEDAILNAVAGEAVSDLAEFGGTILCRDVGYLIRWNSKELVLAVSCSEEDNQFRHSNSIPAKLIREVRVLDRSNRCLTSNPYRTGKKAGTAKTPPPG